MPSSSWQRLIESGIAILFGEKRSRRPRPSERTVHRVRQSYDTSCGIAVTAMFARVSHEEALAAIFPNAQRKRVFYTHYRDVIRGLDQFGVLHGERSVRARSWEAIPQTSLVLVKFTKRAKIYRHWVILQIRDSGERLIIDPDPLRPGTQVLSRAEYERYNPVSYLTVAPKRPLSRRGGVDGEVLR